VLRGAGLVQAREDGRSVVNSLNVVPIRIDLRAVGERVSGSLGAQADRPQAVTGEGRSTIVERRDVAGITRNACGALPGGPLRRSIGVLADAFTRTRHASHHRRGGEDYDRRLQLLIGFFVAGRVLKSPAEPAVPPRPSRARHRGERPSPRCACEARTPSMLKVVWRPGNGEAAPRSRRASRTAPSPPSPAPATALHGAAEARGLLRSPGGVTVGRRPPSVVLDAKD